MRYAELHCKTNFSFLEGAKLPLSQASTYSPFSTANPPVQLAVTWDLLKNNEAFKNDLVYQQLMWSGLMVLQTEKENPEYWDKLASGPFPTGGTNTDANAAGIKGGFGLSIPLWDRGSAGVATQRAQISEDNARLTLKDRQQQVGLEVRRAYLDYQAAIQQLEAAEAQLRAASLALEAAQQRYNVGAATLLEVTQARAAQTQAASALISARYGLLFQRTAIGYYVGDLNPRAASIG